MVPALSKLPSSPTSRYKASPFYEEECEWKVALKSSDSLVTFKSNPPRLIPVAYPCDSDGRPISAAHIIRYSRRTRWQRAISCFCSLHNGGIDIPVKIFAPIAGEHHGDPCLGCVHWKPRGKAGCSYFVNLQGLLEEHPQILTADYLLDDLFSGTPTSGPSPSLTVRAFAHEQPDLFRVLAEPSSPSIHSSQTQDGVSDGPARQLIAFDNLVLGLADNAGPTTRRYIHEMPLPSEDDTVASILKLIDRENPGIAYSQLIASLGGCSRCGQCMGVNMFLYHHCPPLDPDVKPLRGMGLAMHIPPACHSPLAFKPEPSPLPTRLPTPPVIRGSGSSVYSDIDFLDADLKDCLARYSSISHDTASGSKSSSSRSQPLDRLFMPGHSGHNKPNAINLFCADEAHIVPVPHSQKRKRDESDPSIPSSAHFGPALQHSKREVGPSVIDMTEDEGGSDVIDLTKGEVVGSADVIDLTKDED